MFTEAMFCYTNVHHDIYVLFKSIVVFVVVAFITNFILDFFLLPYPSQITNSPNNLEKNHMQCSFQIITKCCFIAEETFGNVLCRLGCRVTCSLPVCLPCYSNLCPLCVTGSPVFS